MIHDVSGFAVVSKADFQPAACIFLRFSFRSSSVMGGSLSYLEKVRHVLPSVYLPNFGQSIASRSEADKSEQRLI